MQDQIGTKGSAARQLRDQVGSICAEIRAMGINDNRAEAGDAVRLMLLGANTSIPCFGSTALAIFW
jgi:hypothetical protein